MEPLSQMVILGLVVGSISLTMTRTYIFRGPRTWFRQKGEWWDKLVTCPYCMSYYVAAFFAAITGYDVFPEKQYIISFMISWMCIIPISAITTGLISLSMRAVGPAKPLEEDLNLDK